jgi:hypothetical protein
MIKVNNAIFEIFGHYLTILNATGVFMRAKPVFMRSRVEAEKKLKRKKSHKHNPG